MNYWVNSLKQERRMYVKLNRCMSRAPGYMGNFVAYTLARLHFRRIPDTFRAIWHCFMGKLLVRRKNTKNFRLEWTNLHRSGPAL